MIGEIIGIEANSSLEVKLFTKLSSDLLSRYQLRQPTATEAPFAVKSAMKELLRTTTVLSISRDAVESKIYVLSCFPHGSSSPYPCISFDT